MPHVFFTYKLRDPADAEELERRLATEIAPAALAVATVLSLTLHKAIDWPGSSADASDYIEAIEVADLERWSDEVADAIVELHGSLRPLLAESGMTVTEVLET
jgi:hypothetical protein